MSSPEIDPKTKTQVHLGVEVRARDNGKEVGEEDKGKACDKG